MAAFVGSLEEEGDALGVPGGVGVGFGGPWEVDPQAVRTAVTSAPASKLRGSAPAGARPIPPGASFRFLTMGSLPGSTEWGPPGGPRDQTCCHGVPGSARNRVECTTNDPGWLRERIEPTSRVKMLPGADGPRYNSNRRSPPPRHPCAQARLAQITPPRNA